MPSYDAFHHFIHKPLLTASDLINGAIQEISDLRNVATCPVASRVHDIAVTVPFFATTNNSWRNRRAAALQTGQERILLKGVRFGDLTFRLTGRSRCGLRRAPDLSAFARVSCP
ncbi:MAG: hypothetical protein ACREOO_22200 [bacterium]